MVIPKLTWGKPLKIRAESSKISEMSPVSGIGTFRVHSGTFEGCYNEATKNGATKGGWDGKEKEPRRNWSSKGGVFVEKDLEAAGR